MPNWCDNQATITAPTEDEAVRLYDAFMDGETCQEYLPIPGSDPDWYLRRSQSWGTKWDFGKAAESGGNAVRDGRRVELCFLSAWSPPLGLYEYLESLGYEVVADFYESGMMFGGWYEDGNLTQISLDVSSEDDLPLRLRNAFGPNLFDWLFDPEDRDGS